MEQFALDVIHELGHTVGLKHESDKTNKHRDAIFDQAKGGDINIMVAMGGEAVMLPGQLKDAAKVVKKQQPKQKKAKEVDKAVK